jgi:hypothetical protein
MIERKICFPEEAALAAQFLLLEENYCKNLQKFFAS